MTRSNPSIDRPIFQPFEYQSCMHPIPIYTHIRNLPLHFKSITPLNLSLSPIPSPNPSL